MAKVTGKLQITLPKAVAEQSGIQVGDELELHAVGGSIRIERRGAIDSRRQRQQQLTHFDQGTERQRRRQASQPRAAARSRGWTRAALYSRGRTR